MSEYAGYKVAVLRDAKEGDPNFDPKKDQVVIVPHGGGEMVVERHEVKEKKTPEHAAAPKAKK
jgi:hypothetical protein